MITYTYIAIIIIILYVIDTYNLKEVEKTLIVSELETKKDELILTLYKDNDLAKIIYKISSKEYHEKVKQKGNNIYLKVFIKYNRLRVLKYNVLRVESI